MNEHVKKVQETIEDSAARIKQLSDDLEQMKWERDIYFNLYQESLREVRKAQDQRRSIEECGQ